MREGRASITEKGELKIEWKLKTIFFNSAILQQNCPCILCVDKLKENKEENVKLIGVLPAGRFGLRLIFSSGCRRGIYSWDYLANLSVAHSVFSSSC